MNATIIIAFLYEGSERNANVREVAGEFDKMYRVVLDDGYENNFFTSTEIPYKWYEQNIGYTDLAEAIGKAIQHVFGD